jgi:magnesium transporter
MISAFDPESHSLHRVDAVPARGWVHVADPTADECAALRVAGLAPDFLAHSLDPDELARLDHDDGGATLVILRVPWTNPGGAGIPYRTVTLGIVIRHEVVLTIERHPTGVADALVAARAVTPGRPTRFLLLLILSAAARFIDHLKAIDREVEQLEGELQASMRNREVLALLRYQKSLVHFATALDSDQLMLERLQRDEQFRIPAEDRDLLEDTMIEIRQASEMATIAGNILGEMMDAFASIISNNLNVVVKLLTGLTLVLSIPTMISSLYGMNVGLPGADHAGAFAAIVLGSFGIAGATAVLFWRRRWL